MRIKLLLAPILLSTTLLVACNNDNSTSLAEKIKTEVAQNIETDMNKAINDAKTDLTDISVTLWILNKNKKERTVEINGKQKNYRDREKEDR